MVTVFQKKIHITHTPK